MNLRKLLVCAVAFGALASTSLLQAQEKKKGGGGRAMTVERIEEAVGKLTDDQKTKIAAINAKTQEKLQAIPQEERREKGREIYTAASAEIRALLTDEQKTKFDAMAQGARGKKKDQ
jgi:periplasmic protein CpxP/Spy